METGIFESIYSKNDIFKLVYFDIQVLQRYFDDPKYLVFYCDYRGSIVISDSYADGSVETVEYLRHFGLAYHNSNDCDRAIVTFADDLIKLPAKMQSHFHSFMLKNQLEYYPNNGFVKNLILGEWEENISIYTALIMEMHYINEMCVAMKLPKIFKDEYPIGTSLKNERPDNFHVILMPTEKQYYDFIITLEKMITGNINIKTFFCLNPSFLTVNRKDEDGRDKGSLRLLTDWMKVNIKFANIENDIEIPLKKLIKLRQIPAHKVFENKYDKNIWKEQNNIMVEIYTAVRNIRLLFSNHPHCDSIVIPSYLYDGEHIVNY